MVTQEDDEYHEYFKENNKVWLAMDVFSRFLWGYLLPNKQTVNVCNGLETIKKFDGKFEVLGSDNALEFDSANVKQFCDVNDTYLHHGKIYTPQHQAPIERAVQTVSKQLAIEMENATETAKQNVDTMILPKALLRLNIMQKQILGRQTPFQIQRGHPWSAASMPFPHETRTIISGSPYLDAHLGYYYEWSERIQGDRLYSLQATCVKLSHDM